MTTTSDQGNSPDAVSSVGEILDRLEQASREKGELSLGEAMDVVGRRAFGPLLLLAGMLTLAPLIGDIPGIPTLLGLLVLLVVTQILFRWGGVWIPHWLEKRSISDPKLSKAIEWMRRPARWADGITRPRQGLPELGRIVHEEHAADVRHLDVKHLEGGRSAGGCDA